MVSSMEQGVAIYKWVGCNEKVTTLSNKLLCSLLTGNWGRGETSSLYTLHWHPVFLSNFNRTEERPVMQLFNAPIAINVQELSWGSYCWLSFVPKPVTPIKWGHDYATRSTCAQFCYELLGIAGWARSCYPHPHKQRLTHECKSCRTASLLLKFPNLKYRYSQ